jgi:hypothetical protein
MLVYYWNIFNFNSDYVIKSRSNSMSYKLINSTDERDNHGGEYIFGIRYYDEDLFEIVEDEIWFKTEKERELYLKENK